MEAELDPVLETLVADVASGEIECGFEQVEADDMQVGEGSGEGDGQPPGAGPDVEEHSAGPVHHVVKLRVGDGGRVDGAGDRAGEAADALKASDLGVVPTRAAIRVLDEVEPERQ